MRISLLTMAMALLVAGSTWAQQGPKVVPANTATPAIEPQTTQVSPEYFNSFQELTPNVELIHSTGYGTIDDRLSTGGISTLIFNENVSQSYSNIGEYIQGRVPGVQVIDSGNSFKLQIRGISSLRTVNEPLVVVDGVHLHADTWKDIDPSIVESITFLKGPSAAIYGTQGGNGVLVVKTRR